MPDRQFKIFQFFDPETNLLTEERWEDEKGNTSRVDGGPAMREWDAVTGKLVYELWYRDDVPHRLAQPAKIFYASDGQTILATEWYHHGRRHRLDGPAVIEIDGTSGTHSKSEWWINDQQVDPRTKSPLNAGPKPPKNDPNF